MRLVCDLSSKEKCALYHFIDEIDGRRQRGAGLVVVTMNEQTLNHFVEMDGFGANEASLPLAATKLTRYFDPALLRPGRFDRQAVAGRPTVVKQSQGSCTTKPLADDVENDVITWLYWC